VKLDAFRDEAQRMCRLKNLADPGIVRIDDFGLPSPEFPFPWYAKEFIEGKTLDDMVQDGSLHTWGFEEKAQCFRHMLVTIERAHQLGVLHYDLHARNVKLAGYLEALTPKIFDFGLQMSGLASSMTGTECLEKLLHAFDGFLRDMFQGEQGFVELWDATVIKEYTAVEDIPTIAECQACFGRIEREFCSNTGNVRVLHDELLRQMRANELDSAVLVLVQLSNVPPDALSQFYGAAISAYTRLRKLYVALAQRYMTQGNGEEGLQQYYKALKPYKQSIPVALSETLWLGEGAEFKYWDSGRFVQQWVSLIAQEEDRFVGYSHRHQGLREFVASDIQHYVWISPASEAATAQATKIRRRDKTDVGDALEALWRKADAARRTLVRAQRVAAIARDFNLPTALLEHSTFTVVLFALLTDRLDTYTGLCASAAWLAEAEDNLAIVDETLRPFPEAHQRLLKLREALETLPGIHDALRAFRSQGWLWYGFRAMVVKAEATLPELAFFNRQLHSLQRVVRRVIFVDNMEHGSGAWTAQLPWALTTETAHSAHHCWTDSPQGHYSNNVNVSLFSPKLDFSGRCAVSLTFWHRYDLEKGYDFGRVWVRTDNGTQFTQVAAFTGTQNTWTQATVTLDAFAGQPSVEIVFQLISDATTTREGWYIDDVVVSGDIAGPDLDLLALS